MRAFGNKFIHQSPSCSSNLAFWRLIALNVPSKLTKLFWVLQVRFVVMGNMFCTELRIHRRFDLKGSSQGRSADKVEIDETTTLKDLDLEYEFRLDPSWRDSLLRYTPLYFVQHLIEHVILICQCQIAYFLPFPTSFLLFSVILVQVGGCLCIYCRC